MRPDSKAPATPTRLGQEACRGRRNPHKLRSMNDKTTDDDSQHRGRADFWRGFLYGTGNTIALAALVALISFLAGLLNGSAGAAP